MSRAKPDDDWRATIAAGRAALQEDPDNLALVHDLAFALTEAAWTFDPDTPVLSREEAAGLAAEAVVLARRLVAAHPEEPTGLARLFWALHVTAHVLEETDPQQARAAYWEAAVVAQRRLAVDPDPDQVREEMVWTLRDAANLPGGDERENAALLDQAM